MGLIPGVSIAREAGDSREPAPEQIREIIRYCYEHGVIALSAGSYSNVIRVLVPLVITDAQWDEGLAVLESAFLAVLEKKEAVTHSA